MIELDTTTVIIYVVTITKILSISNFTFRVSRELEISNKIRLNSKNSKTLSKSEVDLLAIRMDQDQPNRWSTCFKTMSNKFVLITRANFLEEQCGENRSALAETVARAPLRESLPSFVTSLRLSISDGVCT